MFILDDGCNLGGLHLTQLKDLLAWFSFFQVGLGLGFGNANPNQIRVGPRLRCQPMTEVLTNPTKPELEFDYIYIINKNLKLYKYNDIIEKTI